MCIYDFYTSMYIVASWLSLYCTISNHPVIGSIIVKYFVMRGLYCGYVLILNWPIISTNNISHVIDSPSFLGK